MPTVAQQIDCVTTARDPAGRRQIAYVGGPSVGGGRWQLSVEDAIRAIQSGSVFFVTFEAESYIVSIGTAPDGRRYLRTAMGEADSSMLLRLKECGREAGSSGSG